MPIQRYQAVAMTDMEINQAVTTIISNLGSDITAFERASQTYNYDFFKDEPHEFKVSASRALKAHFANFQNSFWNKAAST